MLKTISKEVFYLNGIIFDAERILENPSLEFLFEILTNTFEKNPSAKMEDFYKEYFDYFYSEKNQERKENIEFFDIQESFPYFCQTEVLYQIFQEEIDSTIEELNLLQQAESMYDLKLMALQYIFIDSFQSKEFVFWLLEEN